MSVFHSISDKELKEKRENRLNKSMVKGGNAYKVVEAYLLALSSTENYEKWITFSTGILKELDRQ